MDVGGEDDDGNDPDTAIQRGKSDTSLAQLLIGTVRAEGDLSLYGEGLDAAVTEASVRGADGALARLIAAPLSSGDIEFPSEPGEAARVGGAEGPSASTPAPADQVGGDGQGRGKGMAALQAALRRPRGSIDSLYDDNDDAAAEGSDDAADEEDSADAAGEGTHRRGGYRGGDDGFRGHSPQFGALDDATADERLVGPVARGPSGLPALRRRWRAALHARAARQRRCFDGEDMPLLAGLLVPSPPAVCIAYDARMLLHDEVTHTRRALLPGVPAPPRAPHVERGDRLACVAQHLVAKGLFQRCVRTPSRPARRDEIKLCHSEEHLAQVDSLRAVDETGRRLGADTFANEHTHTAALLAAGSVLAVTESVMRGNTRAGIALVRPPGHHAEPDAIMGFCLLNNAAIAAAAARRHMGAQRVLILDWDVHHGNGTEACFVDDPTVMYVSLHRYEPGFFPGTGDPHDVGVGRGAGFTVNVGWPEGDMRDADYAAAFDTVIMPIARQFNPDLVIVSAGFDAAVEDPLGGCLVTPAGFAMMTSRLRELASGRLVVALEGGYNLAAIALCTEAVTRILLGEAPPQLPVVPSLRGSSPQPGSPGLHGARARPGAWDDVGQSPSPYALAADRAASSRSDWDGSVEPEQDRELAALTPQPAAMAAIMKTVEAHSPHWPALRRTRAAFHHSGVQALWRRAANIAAEKQRACARSMHERSEALAAASTTPTGAPGTAGGRTVAGFGDSPVPSSSNSLAGTELAYAPGDMHARAGAQLLDVARPPGVGAPFVPGVESPAAAVAPTIGGGRGLGDALSAPSSQGALPPPPKQPSEVTARELLQGLTLTALERGMSANQSPAVLPGRGRLGSHDSESESSSSTSSEASGDDCDNPLPVDHRFGVVPQPTGAAHEVAAGRAGSPNQFALQLGPADVRAPKRHRDDAEQPLASAGEEGAPPDPKRGHH
ncbi:hypothetical protein FNF27_06092 [Cafeteria roenbergensis]|uniref:histone deacetylase n=1 Tax=Cafeteria roenbergensis TaxID=33653 RepID=A0A5A8E3J8_CAFRO|nr:hypothetical protein FNF27_06092 [Cafeteria roenbergensis]